MESEKEFLTLKDGYYQNRSFTSNFIKVDGKNFTVHYVVSFDYPDMEAQGLYSSNFLGRSLKYEKYVGQNQIRTSALIVPKTI